MNVVQHVWPDSLKFYTRMRAGLAQSALITPLASGVEVARQYQDWPLRTFAVDLFLNAADQTARDELEGFLWSIGIQLDPFWIVEPHTRLRTGLVGLGDGSRTTWVLPVMAGTMPSDLQVLVDGAVVTYTTHAVSNLLADGEALADWSSGLLIATNCTGSEDAARRYWQDKSSSRGDNATSGGAYIRSQAYSASPSTTYSGVAIVTAAATENVRIYLAGRNSGTFESGSEVDATVGNTDEWQILTTSLTTTASTNEILVLGGRVTAETGPFSLAGLAICPGDLSQWWLPSTSPPAVEFAAAPAEGSVITFRATARHMARVRLSRSAVDQVLDAQLHGRISGLTLHEVQPW